MIFGITSFNIWTMSSPSVNAHMIQNRGCGDVDDMRNGRTSIHEDLGNWILGVGQQATPETLLLVLDPYIERDVGKPERGQ
ncbi:hypothetical protein GRJ2_002427900 [Grus japonensis]|uniref:Uncharacterized protein n=1 Tax=Grus japonensis TaxID=30415 RepID=A0ABC9XPK3_GRUJA